MDCCVVLMISASKRLLRVCVCVVFVGFVYALHLIERNTKDQWHYIQICHLSFVGVIGYEGLLVGCLSKFQQIVR
jgi:hypothetical protein